MADIEASPAPPAASDGMVTLTHVIYGLARVQRRDRDRDVRIRRDCLPFRLAVDHRSHPELREADQVQGTYLASHFTWQIRTFWYALLWAVIAFSRC